MESEKKEMTEISDENEKKETSREVGIEQSRALAKKNGLRLGVSIFSGVVILLFFGLSYFYFTDTIAAVIFAFSVGLIALTIVSIYKKWETVYKLSITTMYIEVVVLIAFFCMNKSGLFRRIESTQDLIDYINHSGGVAEVVFVVLNFLQVTIIPIPSSITTTAGALLFQGIWKPLYLTVIGLVLGSMFAFFLGRVFGVRFANWLVGEKTIAKYRKMTKGRDKIVLFYMFLFPFFPDDFLCILAGMTTYTYGGFFALQIFTRTVGTLTSILLTKGIVSIPLKGPWLLLWGLIVILVIVFLILTIKYSDKIESMILKVIHKLSFGPFAKRKAEVLSQDGVAEGHPTDASDLPVAADAKPPSTVDEQSKGDVYDTLQH